MNDNFPTANSVEGYSVTGANAVYVGPVATGGNGSPTNDPTFFATPLIAIAPGTTHLYASDNATSDIALFDINPANCALTFVANYPSGGNSLFGLGFAISRNGKFIYASNYGRNAKLTVLPIHSDGSLGSPIQTVNLISGFSSMAITADGKTLIGTLPTAQEQMQSYEIDASSGKVTFASQVSTIGAVDGLVIDAHSKFIYAGNGGDGGAADIQVVEIGAGGKLTYIAQNVFNGFDNPVGIAGSSNCVLLSPNGKLLYFSNQVEAQVITLNVVPSTGSLTFNSVVSDGEGFVDEPSQLAMNASGTLIFTGDFSDGIPTMGIFRAAANGTLKSIGYFPLTQNAAATSIAAGSF